MNIDSYILDATDDFCHTFTSVGPKGNIQKLVKYTRMDEEGFYKMEFGDINPSDGRLVIDTISDNKDAVKVFGTVIMSIYIFTNHFKNAYICSHSNSKARLRIYRIGINRYIEEIKKNVHLFIDKDNSWEEYAPDADFAGLMIRRKENSFF